MTAIEWDCLNRIRLGMKLYLRWESIMDTTEDMHVFNAMDYLEDILHDTKIID
jgi:hypothetical protein